MLNIAELNASLRMTMFGAEDLIRQTNQIAQSAKAAEDAFAAAKPVAFSQKAVAATKELVDASKQYVDAANIVARAGTKIGFDPSVFNAGFTGISSQLLKVMDTFKTLEQASITGKGFKALTSQALIFKDSVDVSRAALIPFLDAISKVDNLSLKKLLDSRINTGSTIAASSPDAANVQGVRAAIAALGEYEKRLKETQANQASVLNAGLDGLRARVSALNSSMSGGLSGGLNELRARQAEITQQAQAAAAAMAARQAQFVGFFTGLGQYANFATGALGNLLGRVNAFGYALSQNFNSAVFVGGLSVMTGALVGFGREMIRVERILGPVRELHMALAKTVGEDGAANFRVITDTMVKYGLSIEALSKPIARLKIATDGTLLGGAKFKGFLEDFAAVSSKFALPQESIAGMAKAFEQMISKGTVQAEEFRQQLGDRLPAAARVGLLAYREMFGKSTASFEDFMKAMKNRQIESTRFLDIFMTKQREVFGITKDPAQNLNTVYGQLTASYQMMISNLDNSIGVTRTWTKVLSGVSGLVGTLGDQSDALGTILVSVFGGAAFLAVTKMSALFVGLIGSAGAFAALLSGGALVAYGAQLLLAGYAIKNLIDWFSRLNISIFSSEDATKKLTDSIGKLGLKNSTADVVANLDKIRAAGLALKGEEFKIYGSVVDKDTGKPLFSNPNELISELNRYFYQANQALKSGVKLSVNFDVEQSLNTQISGIEKTMEVLTGKLSQKLMKGGASNSEIMELVPKDKQAEIIASLKTFLAAQKKEVAETFKALEQSGASSSDMLAAVLNAMAQTSTKDVEKMFLAARKSLDVMKTYKSEYDRVKAGMSAIETFKVIPPDPTPWDRIKQLFKDWEGPIRGVGMALGVVAAVNLAGLTVGITGVGAAILTLNGRLAMTRGLLLPLVAAGAILGMSAQEGSAKAAQGYDRVLKNVEELNKAIAANNTAIVQTDDATNVYKMATEKLQAFKAENYASVKAIEDLRGKIERMQQDIASGGPMRGLAGVTINQDTQALKVLTDEYAANQRKTKELEAALVVLERAVASAKIEGSEFAKVLAGIRGEGTELTKVLPNIGDAIQLQVDRMKVLKTEGLKALEEFDKVRAMRGRYSTGDKDNPVPAGDDELLRLQRREAAVAALSKSIGSYHDKVRKLTTDQAWDIIGAAEARMEGFGNKQAAAIRKMGKDIDEYILALRKLGATEEEVAQKVNQFREAIEMQNAGLNMASLQLKPLQALQKGMESFADSFADLLVNGKLNAQSFGAAFKNMALSISKDIVAMIIKANILRPLMQGIFGMGGGGMWGAGGMMGTQPMGGMGSMFGSASFWNGSAFGSQTSFFAKGDVFDGPTGFNYAGGKQGVLGEAGPEAVMPLRRGPNGTLGVQVMGGDTSSAPTYNVTFNVSSPDAGSFRKSESQMAAMLTRMTERGRRNG